MEGMGIFSEAEFDLLGMLFPDESPYAVGVNTTGIDEDDSYCSLVNVDSSLQWSNGFYVPAEDLSTIVNGEKDDSRVQTSESMMLEEGHFVAGKGAKNKRKHDDTVETPKKRPRQSRGVSITAQKRQEGGRTRRQRKSRDAIDREERQSPVTSCSSEDDVNSQQLSASDDLNLLKSSSGVAEVKRRAGRGAATDPQSLYARKRRERINERLKILQNLIPNGTKVDISTMLEEAVHYVKFLQIQIKLLSSDEMWMYAPIAYNGKDIGLNRLFSSQL